MERLPAAEEALFSAAELRAMEHLRDGEFLGAEGFLEDTLRARFEPREGAPAQDALGVAECRLRYLLSKAKVGLDKFLEAEQQLYRSIDSYLRLGVLDDVTVAALLDYSLAVIREQLYDDNGEEKFTPDRFVRAHNVFCGLLFSPHSLPGKCLPSQRFQLSGPVDSATVEAFGLLSPAAVLDTSVAARSPMFKSPFRLQREVSPIKAAEEAPVDTLKYSNDNDMLNSLEKLFYQSRRRKDELGTLALMCADFEDLAEEMDRCLQLDDFCIAPAGEAELELVLHGSAPGVAADIREEPSAADHTTSRRGAEEPVECPGTDAVATRLGSTTGDDFDGDTFDDLLVGQIEDGDVSRVAHVKLHHSPGSHFGSPAARRELDNSDSASFESPPYLHMRPGMAGSGSDAKENTHNGSIAGTDGYSTDNSNWADIVRGTATARGGKKRKSKHLSSPE